MKKSVYIETSIVSYLTARPSRDVIRSAHQKMTRDWWETRRQEFRLVISRLVRDESARGDPQAARLRTEFLVGLPALEVTTSAIELARSLLDRHAMPVKAKDDALHVALAAVHGIDYLLTWNCTHIANADTLWLTLETIRSAGFEPPLILTPQEFAGGTHV